jgi:hypothetical protein
MVRAVAASSVLLGAGTLAACSSGPSTRAEVCSAYDDLGRQVLQGNGLFGNPVFHKADHLSDVAKRYGGADLSADSAALHHIAKSDSTSDAEITQATGGIADLCGHPLGITDPFGGG